MIGIAIGISPVFGGGVTADALLISWATAADDNTPGFTVTLPAAALEDDILTVRRDGTTEYFTHVVSAQNIIDRTFTITNGGAALADGDYTFAIDLEGGGYTDEIDVTINIAPVVDSLSPVDGATGVNLDATTLVVTFDKAVNAGTGFITVYDASDDSVIEAFDVEADAGIGAGLVEFGPLASEVTLRMTDNFTLDLDAYVQIGATAVVNNDGIAFAGITDETTWNFSADTTAGPLGYNFAEATNSQYVPLVF